jgi:hypothetical protein
MVFLPRIVDSQSIDLEPIRTFQTVSLGSSVNKRLPTLQLNLSGFFSCVPKTLPNSL